MEIQQAQKSTQLRIRQSLKQSMKAWNPQEKSKTSWQELR